MKNKLDNLIFFLDNLIFFVALVSWSILPFLVIFGVTSNTLSYIAILAVCGPLRLGYHAMTKNL